jgi:hypothetical protein
MRSRRGAPSGPKRLGYAPRPIRVSSIVTGGAVDLTIGRRCLVLREHNLSKRVASERQGLGRPRVRCLFFENCIADVAPAKRNVL